MLVGTNFLYFFALFMKIGSPLSVGSTFSKNDFCQYRVQDHVSIPKLASKSPLFGGHFHHVLFKNDSFRRLSGKWPSWEAQFHITIDFACILEQIFKISRLILLQFMKNASRPRC